MNKGYPRNDNIIEKILNSIKFIRNQIELIFNSKEIFKNDKELIIFSYLLGYFSFKNNIIYQKEQILNSILEYSCRDRGNDEDISNIIVNLSLSLDNNFCKENLFEYKNNLYFNNKDIIKIKNDENHFKKKKYKEKEKEKEKIIEISDYNKNNENIKNFINTISERESIEQNNINYDNNSNEEKEINNYNNSLNNSRIDNLLNINKNNMNINNINDNKINKNINLDDNINLNNNNNVIHKNKLDSILNDEKRESKFLGKKTLLPKKIKVCDICLEEFDENDSLNYELECGCIIHYECFNEHIKNSIENNNIPILCPYCKIEIHPNYIYNSLHINENFHLIEKYEKFSMNNVLKNHKDNYSCCPTIGCEYIFFFEKGENRFLCPLCNKEYCLFCKEIWHKGMSCQEFQDSKNEKKLDEKFFNFVIGKKYKVCPFCNVWVEKTSGCNHMKCKCGNQFCYKCGNSIIKCTCWNNK